MVNPVTHVHMEWGARAIDVFEEWADVVVVVDVLSFSTAVDVAVSRGALVVPCALGQPAAERLGDELGAFVAVPRKMASKNRPYSLSPESLSDLPAGTKLVLPSPNGAALTAALTSTGKTVIAGCLRNATAVGAYAANVGSRIGVLAAGERWPDGSLRPALEDFVGAGAVIAAINDAQRTPEAAAAEAVFTQAEGDLLKRLSDCTSGRELQEAGYSPDVSWAAKLDISPSIPHLQNGQYIPCSDLGGLGE